MSTAFVIDAPCAVGACGTAALCAFALLGAPSIARAQDTTPAVSPTASSATQETALGRPTLEIYGFGQADLITESGRTNPDWYDVARPSRLPSGPLEFGQNGHAYASVRQSRFGARSLLPTPDGDVKATFEFDMFGVGKDSGRTTIRLRHAYGQWKQFGAGQTNSTFTDVDVSPNSLDYWGPNGMLSFRNVQVFWEPYRKGDTHVRLAVEHPGASADTGVYAERVEMQNVKPRFPAPDVTGHYRYADDNRGYVQIGGAVRYMAYDDVLPDDQFNLSGHVWGWGGSVSTGLKAGKHDLFHLQAIYGEGIENYFNDAPIDVGAQASSSNPITPIVGKSLPILGLVAFLDHNWSDKWTTALGYSRVDVRNSDLQAANAFKVGQYALANLLCVPVKNVMMGAEVQWVQRRNFSDGWQYDDFRVQVSFRYGFSYTLGG